MLGSRHSNTKLNTEVGSRGRHKLLTALAWLLGTGLVAVQATAAPKLRVRVDQHGDFRLIGNVLGQNCASYVPSPVVGTVRGCGRNTPDSAPDVFWRADDNGDALADVSVQPSQARSSAVLSLPPGAKVTHAFLYWGASGPNSQSGITGATIDRPGVFAQSVQAIDHRTVDNINSAHTYYQSVADITRLVQVHGDGVYRVGPIAVDPFKDRKEDVAFAGWAMVVFYSLPSEPPRNLTLFDGLDAVYVRSNVVHTASATLSGFLVPNAGFDAKLGVVAYEGDRNDSGDSLLFGKAPLDSSDAISDALNPSRDFFNGSRAWLGAPVSVQGDLPQLSGQPGSLSSLDIDVVDISSKLHRGQTSADIKATTRGDWYFLGVFVTSISTYQPIFASSTKTVEDVNGGALRPGDELQYTLTVVNSGNDVAIGVELKDPLPAGVTYKPGSIRILSGPGQGSKTDSAGDDQCEYQSSSRTIRCRLGVGADAVQGGSLAVGQETKVRFSVIVDANASGSVKNQAFIEAAGQRGAPKAETPTDGNGSAPGAPPTEIHIDECATDSDCTSGSKPRCDTAADPNVCVECLQNSDCGGSTPACSPARICIACRSDSDCTGNTPACLASGACGECSASNQTKCKGATPVCDTASATCVECNTDSDCNTLEPICDTSKHQCLCKPSGPEVCGNQVDEDCDGQLDNGCGDSDGDGLSDMQEELIGTDPHDADSDDDGVPDGQEPDGAKDTDGDGLINALDPDSDNDGLADGTEMGKDCSGKDTDPAAGHCVPDADAGQTTTDPLNPDTDGGGASDGSEDANLNGKVDSGEQDPTVGHQGDDSSVVDNDGDGLSDALEKFLGSNPNDADTDDDGVRDGEEPNPASDMDGDGAADVLDADSDNDGLLDGTELGKDCSGEGTDPTAHVCKPDADRGKTTTSAVDPDTDGGGATDGSEDSNLDGKVDQGETDPTLGHDADDGNVKDSDGDGLGDRLEDFLGSDPRDTDSDDDGVPDGKEANPSADTDGDGSKNVLDEDSDGDGLMDGTELGLGCDDPGTDNSQGHCVPDGDRGQTKTSPVLKDTDHGGVDDGDEDSNHDGKVDQGETDPNNRFDDVSGQSCSSDAQCGAADSGMVCADGKCAPGCRGTGGNGCPEGQQCTSDDERIGRCVTPGADQSGGDAPQTGLDTIEGGGCACSVPSQHRRNWPVGLLALAGMVALWMSRRKERSDS